MVYLDKFCSGSRWIYNRHHKVLDYKFRTLETKVGGVPNFQNILNLNFLTHLQQLYKVFWKSKCSEIGPMGSAIFKMLWKPTSFELSLWGTVNPNSGKFWNILIFSCRGKGWIPHSWSNKRVHMQLEIGLIYIPWLYFSSFV